MSSTVDANLLLYASDSASQRNARAREVLEELGRGPDLLYLFWPVVMAYLRVATHPAVFERPLSPEVAARNVEGLLSRPHVRSPGEDDGFWDLYRAVSRVGPVRGNLVPDAHIATLMRQSGVKSIWSHDRDFRKFEGITVFDPFG